MAEVEEELIGDLDYEFDDLQVDEEEEEALLAEEQSTEEEIVQEEVEEEDLIIECHDDKNELTDFVISPALNEELLEQVEDEDEEEEETETKSRDRFRSERTKLSLTSEMKYERQIPDSLDQVPVLNVERKGNNKRGRNARRGHHNQGKRFGGMHRPILNQQSRMPVNPWHCGMMPDANLMHLQGPPRPNMMPIQMSRGRRLPMAMGYAVLPRQPAPPMSNNYLVHLRSPWVQGCPQVPPEYSGQYLDFSNTELSAGTISPKKRPMLDHQSPIPNKMQCVKKEIQPLMNSLQPNAKPFVPQSQKGSVKSRLSRPPVGKPSSSNPNLKPVPVVEIKLEKKEPEIEVKTEEVVGGEDRSYIKEMEEQKRKREEFLRAKERRRQEAIAKAVQEGKTVDGDSNKAQNKDDPVKALPGENKGNARPRVSLPPQANVKPRIVNDVQNARMERHRFQRPQFNVRPMLRSPFPRPSAPPEAIPRCMPPPTHPPQRPRIPTEQFQSPRFPPPQHLPPQHPPPQHPRPFYPDGTAPPRPYYANPNSVFRPIRGAASDPSYDMHSLSFNTNAPMPDLSVPPPLPPQRPPVLHDTSVPPPQTHYVPYEQDSSYNENYDQSAYEDEQNYEGQYYPEDQYNYDTQPYEGQNVYQTEMPPLNPQPSVTQSVPMSQGSTITPDLRSRLGKKPQLGQKIKVLSAPTSQLEHEGVERKSRFHLYNQPKPQKKTVKTMKAKYKQITKKRNGEVVMITHIPIDASGNVIGPKIVTYKKPETESPPSDTATVSNVMATKKKLICRVGGVNKVAQVPTNVVENVDRKLFFLKDLIKQKKRMIPQPDDPEIQKAPMQNLVSRRTVISGSSSSQCLVKLGPLPQGTTDDDIWDAASENGLVPPVNIEVSEELGECEMRYDKLQDAREFVNFISVNGINGHKVRATLSK